MTADVTAPPLEVHDLTKEYRGTPVVDRLSFQIRRGTVTGFLGPNGAGKTTTLKMLLGLTRPTRGQALVGGRPIAEHPRPGQMLGAALETTGHHAGRTGRNHLRCLASGVRADDRRVDELMEVVGLTDAARLRVGGYSLGMRQRLSLAAALLGDPEVLVLDEPANGLDPQGVAWLRSYLRSFAASGRTAFVSSHLLTEMTLTVDDVILLSRGIKLFDGPIDALLADGRGHTRVVVADAAGAVAVLTDGGHTVREMSPPGHATQVVTVDSDDAVGVGNLLRASGQTVLGVEMVGETLESRFMVLVSEHEGQQTVTDGGVRSA